jgi:hypothetical protein
MSLATLILLENRSPLGLCKNSEVSRADHKVLFTSFEHRWAPRSAQTARDASGIVITMPNSAININVLNGASTEETERLNGSAAPLYD